MASIKSKPGAFCQSQIVHSAGIPGWRGSRVAAVDQEHSAEAEVREGQCPNTSYGSQRWLTGAAGGESQCPMHHAAAVRVLKWGCAGPHDLQFGH